MTRQEKDYIPTIDDLEKRPGRVIRRVLQISDRARRIEALQAIGNLLGILGDENTAHTLFGKFKDPHLVESIKSEHATTRMQLYLR